jgi:phosphatidylglycerol---prolipoprotein diacylglyceryl transferase
MHPVLFHLPGIGPVNAYGTLILLGGLAAMPGVYRDIRARGMAPGRAGSMLIDFYLVLVFGAAIGGRVLHVLTVPGSYVDDPRRLVAMDGTGFVFFGSLFAIVLGFLWLARRYGTTFGAICDLGATWIPLGHVFGRLGCWFAGCCWGAPTDAAWGVQFPAESVAWLAAEIPREGEHTTALHPVQLYESIALALLFSWLWWTRWVRGIEPTWRQAGRYAAGYGIVRTLIEPLRGDASRGLLVEVPLPPVSRLLGLPPEHPLLLSISQAIGLLLVAAGIWALARSRRGQPAAA